MSMMISSRDVEEVSITLDFYHGGSTYVSVLIQYHHHGTGHMWDVEVRYPHLCIYVLFFLFM